MLWCGWLPGGDRVWGSDVVIVSFWECLRGIHTYVSISNLAFSIKRFYVDFYYMSLYCQKTGLLPFNRRVIIGRWWKKVAVTFCSLFHRFCLVQQLHIHHEKTIFLCFGWKKRNVWKTYISSMKIFKRVKVDKI